MSISEGSPKGLIAALQDHARGKYVYNPDFETVIEVVFDEEEQVRLEKLSFTAKYIKGLFIVLQNMSGNPEVKNSEETRADLEKSIKEFHTMLKGVIEEKSPRLMGLYGDIENGPSFTAIMKMIDCFALLKQYMNDKKRGYL